MIRQAFRRLGTCIAIVDCCALAPSRAQAATTTTNFNVTATVQASCVVSANNLAFGTYSGTEVDISNTITVSCNNTTAYNVGLNAGTTSGATVSTRQMAGPSSSVLNYSLFRDSARSQNWGNTVGTDTVSGTGNGSSQTLTVYGVVPAGQRVTPGSYSDTIVVTVSY